MKEKFLQILIVLLLILTLTGINVIFLGNQVILAIYEELDRKNVTTNVENVEFNATISSNINNIQNGGNILINILVKEVGIFEDAKIKVENANFKFKQIQNQYIKNINTDSNEIELNQMVAGTEVQIEVPIEFEKINELNKQYLSQTAKIKLTGSYKKEENIIKKVKGEKELQVNWEEEEQISFEQKLEKYIELGEKQTLIQQKIDTKIVNNTLVKGKELEIEVPEVEYNLPETVDLLINGKKSEQEEYVYDKQNKRVIIQNTQSNNQENDEYKIIYYYTQNIEKDSLKLNLNTKLKVFLYTDELVEKDGTQEVEIQKNNNPVSIESNATNYIYKGYLYSGLDKNTNYQEKDKIEVSTLVGKSEIKIGNLQANFVNSNENKSITDKTYIKDIKLNKNNLQEILGENFYVKIMENQIDKNSHWNENGEIEINLEEQKLETVEITFSEPTKIGTLEIITNKYIKGQTKYSKDELKSFTSLENTKTMTVGDNSQTVSSIVELKDTISEAKLNISTTEFSNYNKNENIQINAILKSDSEKYDLYKNPYIELKFPEEMEQIDIHSINVLYGKELKALETNYDETNKILSVKFEGEQTDFKTSIEEGIQLAINADLTFKKNISSKETQITLVYTNENSNEYQYETTTKININAKYGAILYNNITGFNEENTVIESIDNQITAGLGLVEQEKNVNINQTFINNYETPIDSIIILGNLSGMDAKIMQNIATNKENAKIYYSSNENATLEENTWNENMQEVEQIKSYKIEIPESLQPHESTNIEYQLLVPPQTEQEMQVVQKTETIYNYNGQHLNQKSSILLQGTEKETLIKQEQPISIVQEDNGIKAEITAISADKELKEGEEIYEGQPVKYSVKITNNTGTDLENFEFIAEHTNAVFYIEQEVEATVTDSPDDPETMILTRKDEKAKNITKKLDILKAGETQTFTYEFIPKKENGEQITGKITVKANDFSQKFTTITNTIKESQIGVEIFNYIDEQYILREQDAVTFAFCITNYSGSEQKNIELEIQASSALLNINDTFIEFLKTQGIEVVEDSLERVILKIDSIEAGKEKVINWKYKCDTLNLEEEELNVSVYATAKIGNNLYYSNRLERPLIKSTPILTGKQSVNVENNQVEVGDVITYTAEITNLDSELEAKQLELEHYVTLGNAKIQKAFIRNARR